MWGRELDWIEPEMAAMRLAGLPSLAFLDSAMAHPTLGRYSYLAADPFALFTVRQGRPFWNGTAEPEAPLTALRRRLADHAVEHDDAWPPFPGGAVGAVNYDFGWSLQDRPSPVGSSGEDMRLAFHDIVVVFDRGRRSCRLIASGHPARTPAARCERAQRRLDAFEARLAARRPELAADTASVDPLRREWRPDRTREAYCAGVERVKAYIRAGDIYQANIARRFTAEVSF